jgi:hypothetical protein
MDKVYQALLEAMQRGDTQGAKEIIGMQSKTVNYVAVFEQAADIGNTEVLRILEPLIDDVIERVDGDQVDNYGWQDVSDSIGGAFSDAFENGHCEAVRYIAEKYKDWHDEATVLLRMYHCGHQDYVDRFVNDCVNHKETICRAIDMECSEGELKTVKYFVKSCSLNIKVYEKSLLEAARFGNFPIVKYIVKKGASATIKNEAAINATHYGHLPIFKYLIKKGASSLSKSDALEAIQYACMVGCLKSVKYFVKSYNMKIKDYEDKLLTLDVQVFSPLTGFSDVMQQLPCT